MVSFGLCYIKGYLIYVQGIADKHRVCVYMCFK